jgi:type II secretion system protein H
MAERRPNAGLTIIELMIVLALVGILTGVAYFRLGPPFRRAQVRSAANVLITDLQYAQLTAVRRGKPIEVTLNTGTRTYTIAERGGTPVYRERTFGSASDFRLDQLTATPSSVTFFPGGIAGQYTLFTLGQAGYTRQVSLTRAGQIRILPAP